MFEVPGYTVSSFPVSEVSSTRKTLVGLDRVLGVPEQDNSLSNVSRGGVVYPILFLPFLPQSPEGIQLLTNRL